MSSACLIVLLVAIPAGSAFASPVPLAGAHREVQLGLEWIRGTVRLPPPPFDPRSPDLARRSPALADGLWSGWTDGGVLVRVAETPEGTVGVAVDAERGSWLVEEDVVLRDHLPDAVVRPEDLRADDGRPGAATVGVRIPPNALDGPPQG